MNWAPWLAASVSVLVGTLAALYYRWRLGVVSGQLAATLDAQTKLTAATDALALRATQAEAALARRQLQERDNDVQATTGITGNGAANLLNQLHGSPAGPRSPAPPNVPTAAPGAIPPAIGFRPR